MFSDVLLTVDFDRTLTAPDSTVPARNIEAIRYFIDNGGAFTVNTGRSVPMAAKNIIGVVPVNVPLLLYNGSAAYDTKTGTLTQLCPIDLDRDSVIREVKAAFPDLNVEQQGVNAHYLFQKNGIWEAFCDAQPCANQHGELGQDYGPFLKLSLYGEIRDTTVAQFYEGTAEEMERMDEAVRWLKEKYGEKIEIFLAAPRIIDIHAKGVSKLDAARKLQKTLNRKLLVCVGDAENDVPMLSGADFAYCPADAILADRFENVCNCAEGAVADVIYKKIPMILKNILDNLV